MRDTLIQILRVSLGVAIPLAAFAAGLQAVGTERFWLWKRPSLLLRSLLAVLVVVPIGTMLFLAALEPAGVLRAGIVIAILSVGIGPAAAWKRARAKDAPVAY